MFKLPKTQISKRNDNRFVYTVGNGGGENKLKP
jgi:hypothetical protein